MNKRPTLALILAFLSTSLYALGKSYQRLGAVLDVMFCLAVPAVLMGLWISARRKEREADLFIESLTDRDKGGEDDDQ